MCKLDWTFHAALSIQSFAKDRSPVTSPPSHVVIIGAGIGGLAAALRLAHKGLRVTVLERLATPGGKMRTVPSVAGPVDAGPTVLTMKPVFEALFADVGLRLADHVTLEPQDILARHFWADGTRLDLMADHDASLKNVRDAFGPRAADEFDAFSARAKALFDAFEAPMMHTPKPRLAAMTACVLRNPRLIPAMAPHRSLGRSLRDQFTDPRLAQLFARYATYVGGLPDASPALLALVWQAERAGVWHVRGGMHALARAIADRAAAFGAEFHYNTQVTQIDRHQGRVCSVQTNGATIKADAVLFNGDPAALSSGLLGSDVGTVVSKAAVTPRSLSATVLSFAAIPSGVDLAGHNVFFAHDPHTEYAPLAQGKPQTDPTLYVCAQDRFNGTPTGPERFEIILNQPATDATGPTDQKESTLCHSMILERLHQFGLSFDPAPTLRSVTMPQDFAALFPASAGALYGRSPHGMMAAFKRPTARTAVAGLYLTGGGAHPGAGVPMATLSARHAAAAILRDLPSMSPSHRAATRGGTSTASAMTAPAPSRSSGS